MTQEISSTATKESQFQIPWAGLGTALAWSVSAIFIRAGLAEMASPVVGVAIGLTVNVLIYGILVLLRRKNWRDKPIPAYALRWQIVAAVFVSIATWARWVALETVSIAVVSAIERLSVPIVIVLSLFMLDQTHERINWRVWVGGLLIVSGALVLTFA